MSTSKRKGGKHRAAESRSSARKRINLSTKQKRILAIAALFIVVTFATYGRSIIKLRIENRELQTQHEELVKEKKKLTKELKNINSRDYIEEQARKHLRLLNKDEILFIFKDEEDGNTAENEEKKES